LKEGEVVLRLTAKKLVKCRECHGWIYPGETFLLDVIPYVEAFGPFRRVIRVKRPIHEYHWKGSEDVIVDRRG
jgi:hypothetical protein